MSLTVKKLDRWSKEGNLKRLHLALEYNDFKIRLHALELLRKIGDRSSLPFLDKLISDPFLQVVEECLKTIRSISPNHESIQQFEVRIHELKDFNLKRAAKTSQSFTPLTETEEKKRLEQMAKDYDIMKIYQLGLKEEKRQILDWKKASLVGGTITLIAYLLQYFLHIL